MDKYDILLIRACKAFPNSRHNNLRRLRRIWCLRCGIKLEHFSLDEIDSYILSHLMELIVDEFPKDKLKQYMFRLCQANDLDLENGYGCTSGKHDLLIKTISTLRLTRPDRDFKSDFISPAKYRS
jgi:hypothetical protein